MNGIILHVYGLQDLNMNGIILHVYGLQDI